MHSVAAENILAKHPRTAPKSPDSHCAGGCCALAAPPPSDAHFVPPGLHARRIEQAGRSPPGGGGKGGGGKGGGGKGGGGGGAQRDGALSCTALTNLDRPDIPNSEPPGDAGCADVLGWANDERDNTALIKAVHVGGRTTHDSIIYQKKLSAALLLKHGAKTETPGKHGRTARGGRACTLLLRAEAALRRLGERRTC